MRSSERHEVLEFLNAHFGQDWPWEILLVNEDEFLIEFPTLDAVRSAVSEGPYRFNDLWVTLKLWSLETNAVEDNLSLLVTIYLDGLPFHGWNEETVALIIGSFGVLHHIDADCAEKTHKHSYTVSLLRKRGGSPHLGPHPPGWATLHHYSEHPRMVKWPDCEASSSTFSSSSPAPPARKQ